MSSPDSLAGGDRLRLFCALALPDDVVVRIAAWQEAHLSGGRIIRSADLHITLAFLGGRPRGELPAILDHLREAAARATRPVLTLRRYRETPRVGMLVLEDRRPGPANSQALAYDVQARMEGLGIPLRERRPWTPHITVMRFRDPPRLRPELPELGEFSPSEAAVYHSLLRPGGAQYEVLESVALGG